MNAGIEQVYQALFDTAMTSTLAGSGGAPAFNAISSRRWQQYDQVPPSSQPALFQREAPGRGDQIQAQGLERYTLKATLWIYAQHGADSSAIPSTTLNNLLTALLTALEAPEGADRQWLGLQPWQISNAWVDGTIYIDEGNAPDDTQMIAIVPVTIELGQ
jgi:hypothetical protein